jgi:hypothetical protein
MAKRIRVSGRTSSGNVTFLKRRMKPQQICVCGFWKAHHKKTIMQLTPREYAAWVRLDARMEIPECNQFTPKGKEMLMINHNTKRCAQGKCNGLCKCICHNKGKDNTLDTHPDFIGRRPPDEKGKESAGQGSKEAYGVSPFSLKKDTATSKHTTAPLKPSERCDCRDCDGIFREDAGAKNLCGQKRRCVNINENFVGKSAKPAPSFEERMLECLTSYARMFYIGGITDTVKKTILDHTELEQMAKREGEAMLASLPFKSEAEIREDERKKAMDEHPPKMPSCNEEICRFGFCKHNIDGAYLYGKSEGRKEMLEEIEKVVENGMILGLERVGFAIRAWVAKEKETQWLSEQKKKEVGKDG